MLANWGVLLELLNYLEMQVAILATVENKL